jgi:hypothetical protein
VQLSISKEAVKFTASFLFILRQGQLLPAQVITPPVVYKDDFNKVVALFLELLMAREDFFKLQQTLAVFRLLQEEKEVFFFQSKSY